MSKKQAKGERPSGLKTPKGVVNNSSRVRFRFQKISWSGSRAFPADGSVGAVLTALCAFCDRTWQELYSDFSKNGQSCKRVEFQQLNKETREAIKAKQIDEAAILYQLRLTTKERVIGFIQGGDLWLLLYTPEHAFFDDQR